MNALRDIDIGIGCDGATTKDRRPVRTIKCTGIAVYVVTGHSMDHCDDESMKALDPHGNWSAFLCSQCTAAIVQAYSELFGDRPSVRCHKCYKVFHKLHDMIQVDHLVQGQSI